MPSSASPRRGSVRRPAALLLILALVVAVVATPALAAIPDAPGRFSRPAEDLRIDVRGTRADLVSGGTALVEVTLPVGADAADLSLDLDGRDVSDLVAQREDGRILGLVDGLALGPNRLTAHAGEGPAARLTITNHPQGGPVFAGEQIQPWPCFEQAVDEQCGFPATYAWHYMPADGGGFQPYDPADPPSDVGTTTTDEGDEVPYIVREEIGSQDRGEYRVAVLMQPGDPEPTPWAPPAAWNRKVYLPGGSGCGMHHGQTSAPGVLDDNALRRGFAVISTSLLHNTLNCNLVVQAEALTMLKEHVTEAYGEIRYTIGSGCSGGSIYQQQVANAYPGIFDGIIPACSYPDTWSTMIEVQDCALLRDYWTDPTRWGAGVVWTPTQLAAIAGHESISVCHSWKDVFGFSESLNPRLSTHPLDTQSCNVTAEQAYDPDTNPDGVRCALQDYMVSVFGRRPADGFANRPWDNVGVQYGLDAFLDGTISAGQFIDLNRAVGSYDIDYEWQPQRVAADPAALPVTYRGGLVNQGENLDLVPMIDLRGHDTVEIHHDYRSYVMRARLDAANGHHDNQVIWTGAIPLVGDTTFAEDALTVMDEWLAAIEADDSDRPLEEKVVANKPAAAVDRCTDGTGRDLPNAVCPTLNPYYASPRIVAGSPFTEDAMKCQLEPLRRTDYAPRQLTDAEWQALQETFPDGVCDWSRPGVGQQPTVAWMTYADGPGGEPMPPPPRSRRVAAG